MDILQYNERLNEITRMIYHYYDFFLASRLSEIYGKVV